MQYTEKEIIRSYNQADNKLKQILILAELNATKGTIIADILASNGIDTSKYKKKCMTCGKTFIGTPRARKCDECKEEAENEKRLKREKQQQKKEFHKLVKEWLKKNG